MIPHTRPVESTISESARRVKSPVTSFPLPRLALEPSPVGAISPPHARHKGLWGGA